jgi:alginate O-acetyltransferase complex protein AlgJ
MLRHYRRYWVIPIFLLLSLPALLHGLVELRLVDRTEQVDVLNPPPVTTRKLPARIDAFLSSNFGWRHNMIVANGAVRYFVLGSGNANVYVGREGRMFYRDQEAIAQSYGAVLRTDRVAATAEFLANLKDVLASRGAKLYVAMPPNGSTIYRDYLPATVQGQTTEYDLMMRQLSAKGIAAVDLRPVLQRLREEVPSYYAYDTHWTESGAIGAFNAIADLTGSDWRFEPAGLPLSGTFEYRGDLARMLGVRDFLSERTRIIAREGTVVYKGPGNPAAIAIDGQRGGPTVLIIGDSFSESIPWLLQRRAGRAVWLHHSSCEFDWELIERFKPDQVWWLPVERSMICARGSRPLGAPAAISAVR